jgi:hypothetical protein
MSEISKAMAEWGRKGGQSRSVAKRQAAQQNIVKARTALARKILASELPTPIETEKEDPALPLLEE